MEAWEIMISESQERMVAAVRPQMLDAVREVCARWELPCTVDRRGDGRRRAARASRRRDRRRDPGAAPHGRVPALRGRAAATRGSGADAPPAALRVEALDLRAVRPPRRLANRAQARARRGVLRLAPSMRGLAVSLQGGDFAARPFAARRDRRVRRGAERRVRRRPADRLHGLPQLRQSGEARDRVGAGARRSTASRLRRTRSARRSSPATCRSTTRPTDARSRRRRSSAASGSCPTCGASRTRWRAGDAVVLASVPAGALDVAAEAALVAFLWKVGAARVARARRRQRRARGRARGGGGVERPARRRRAARRSRSAARRSSRARPRTSTRSAHAASAGSARCV